MSTSSRNGLCLQKKNHICARIDGPNVILFLSCISNQHRGSAISDLFKQGPFLVHFFGPDGAGKSTQAHLLLKYLKSKDYKVKKTWIRSPHSLAFYTWKLFVKLWPHRTSTNPYGSQVKLPPTISGIHQKIWVFLELTSLVPLLPFRVFIPLKLGYIMIAERYLFDSITTIAYFVNDYKFIRSRFASFLLRFIPNTTIFIFLDSPYEELLMRRGKSVEPKDVIEFHRMAYRELANRYKTHYIDTSEKTIKQTHAKIIKIISNNLS